MCSTATRVPLTVVAVVDAESRESLSPRLHAMSTTHNSPIVGRMSALPGALCWCRLLGCRGGLGRRRCLRRLARACLGHETRALVERDVVLHGHRCDGFADDIEREIVDALEAHA